MQKEANLGRTGSIAIIQLLVPPEPTAYLIDVHILGSQAFDLSTASSTSLRSILQSNSSFKVFFDIRHDSNALFAHFCVKVAGIIELQVLEHPDRYLYGAEYVNGFGKCISGDLLCNSEWPRTNAEVGPLFKPECGGSYEIFLERPLRDDVIKYCEQDVMLMPELLALYGPKLTEGLAVRVQEVVDERIRDSRSASFSGKGRHMAVGSSMRFTDTDAGTHFSPEISMVRSANLVKLCQLDAPRDQIQDLDEDPRSRGDTPAVTTVEW